MATATINGIRLHYVDTGTPTASAVEDPLPLVMLHGLGCSSGDWDFQLPVLSTEYRLIAPCLRGFGKSDKPAGPYTVSELADDVRALLGELRAIAGDPRRAREHLLETSMIAGLREARRLA